MKTTKQLLKEARNIRNQILALRADVGEVYMQEQNEELEKIFEATRLELDNVDEYIINAINLLSDASGK